METPTAYTAWVAVLLASLRDLTPTQQTGTTSGPGNQGSRCTANIQGQAGTAGVRLSVPRMLNFGQSWES